MRPGDERRSGMSDLFMNEWLAFLALRALGNFSDGYSEQAPDPDDFFYRESRKVRVWHSMREFRKMDCHAARRLAMN